MRLLGAAAKIVGAGYSLLSRGKARRPTDIFEKEGWESYLQGSDLERAGEFAPLLKETRAAAERLRAAHIRALVADLTSRRLDTLAAAYAGHAPKETAALRRLEESLTANYADGILAQDSMSKFKEVLKAYGAADGEKE